MMLKCDLNLNGILLVNKPVGPTSHDIVDFIRVKFGIKKAGHAGTLDPFASGLLILLLGDATKRQNEFMASDKKYIVTMRLGISTDTGDLLGKTIFQSNNPCPDRETLEKILISEFTGELVQNVPMYSAAKFKGTPLYKLARKNIKLLLPPKRIEIKEIKIVSYNPPNLELFIHCSKGTYIRQLCHDLGSRLGLGAHARTLKRTASGEFNVENAVNMDDLNQIPPGELQKLIFN